MKQNKLIISLTLIFLSFQMTTAQTGSNNSEPKKVNFIVGGGLGFVPQYEGSNDILLIPGLTLSANWKSGQYIRLAGLGINANILSNKKWEFGPRLGFKLPRDESIVDNTNVSLLKELDFALSAGLFTRYKFGKGFDIEANYTQDISGVNDGGLANLEVGYNWKIKKFINRIAVNTSYATDNYMDTYFGVNAYNIGTSNLQFYDIDAGIKDVGASLTSIYVINKKWMLVGRLSYKNLLNKVADSPIVIEGSNHQLSGGIALTYKF